MKCAPILLALLLVLAPACYDRFGDDRGAEGTATSVNIGSSSAHDDDHHHHEHEVFTTIMLTFAPSSGDDYIVASWADPEGDGSPVIDPINLTNGETYAVTVQFFNELEDPAEDMTPEVLDENDEHQVFFYGAGVSGPSSDSEDAMVAQAYDDEDGSGFPVGLSNTFEAVKAGTGTMSVLLRHMPTVNGATVKTATLAYDLKYSGVTALPGSTEINVDFEVTVQ